MQESPDMVNALQRWIEAEFEAVHTCVPARILTYSGHQTRLARVEPLVGLLMATGDRVPLPPIDNVPVVFPSSKDASIVFPLSEGDGVLLVFSESGIGNFLNSDGTAQVDADDQSRFSLTDAIAIPGLWPSNGKFQKDLPEDGLVVSHKKVVLHLKDDSVEVTAPSGFDFNGDLRVSGEVTANAGTPTAVSLTTHIHPTSVGPTDKPLPGS